MTQFLKVMFLLGALAAILTAALPYLLITVLCTLAVAFGCALVLGVLWFVDAVLLS